MEDKVILVDENDNPVGVGDKLLIHQKGLLHRAFSIFIYNSKGQLLIQQRAEHKYHSGDLWTNTCCSHPRVGEELIDAAHRRLMEEMGFDCPLQEVFSFVYKVKLQENLYEHELDHILLGEFNGKPTLNPAEVKAWDWIDPVRLQREIRKNPEKFTYWFKLVLDKAIGFLPKI